MAKKKFITTPIYYINDKPHIGHAYTTIATDVLSRYYKSKGEDVFFLTGTDEHGAKITEAAEKAGKKPKEFVDSLIPKFETAWKNLNIEYDQFFRTTNPDHEKIVQEFILKLKENGYVEKKKYEGLYCVGCERFMQKDELIDGKCSDHGTKPKLQSEENYFFLLKKAAKDFDLTNVIKSDKFKVKPLGRKNEILGKIDNGLEDVSISRTGVEWGIEFPDDKDQTIYVWIDALINYFSAPKIYKEEIWPPDIQLMAKDILWFHAVIWPAMLLAYGEKDLPKLEFAHGFFTVDGKKMSKTVGNVLDPNDLVEKFGADAVRYALLREFPFGEDGDISEEKIANRYQSDLGNGLGNLLNRTISLIIKANIKPLLPNVLKIDEKGHVGDVTESKTGSFRNAWGEKIIVKSGEGMSFRDFVSESINRIAFDVGLIEIWKLIIVGNGGFDKYKPWELIKNNKQEQLEEFLNTEYEMLWCVMELIAPFMPDTARKMKNQLESLEPKPLFPRLED